MQSRITSRGLKVVGSEVVTIVTGIKSAAFGLALIANILVYNDSVFSEETIKHEFIPSVQDSITQFYPIRSIYQIFIALLSFFYVVFYGSLFIVVRDKSIHTGNLVGALSLLKGVSLLTFSCIPFRDDAKANSNGFVVYLLSTLALIHVIQSTIRTRNQKLNQQRKRLRNLFLATMIVGTVFFYKHQVEQVKYAYSMSSLCQWVMIGIEIYFDSLFTKELRDVILQLDFPESKASSKAHIV